MRVTGAAENKSVGPILLGISRKSAERSIITKAEKRKTSFPFSHWTSRKGECHQTI